MSSVAITYSASRHDCGRLLRHHAYRIHATATATFPSIRASTVTFTDSDGEGYAGTISGRTLTFNDEGMSAVFVK